MQKRTARAYFWAIVETGSRQCLGMVFFLILARLLPPYTLGLFAAATVSLDLAKCFFDEPVGEVIVQRHRITRAEVDTLFWTLLLVAIAMLGAIDAAAGLLASLYHAPEIIAITCALSIATLIGSLATVPQALIRRRMDFRSLANRQMAGHILSGSVTVGAALLGWGVWSLVAGQIVATTVCTILVWRAVKWRPRLSVSGRALVSMLPYARSIVLIRLIQTARGQIDKLLIGAMFGMEVLGFYAVAIRIAGVLTDGVLGAFNQVNLVSLAKTQRSALFNERFYAIQTFTALALGPAYTALLTSGGELVSGLLGGGWHEAGRLLPWLAISGCCAVVFDTHSVAFRSINRPSWALAMSGLSLAADALLIVFVGRWNILTLVSAIAIKNIAAAALVTLLGHATLGTHVAIYAARLLPVLLACAAMAAASVLVEKSLSDHGIMIRVGGSLGAGALVYVAISAAVFRDSLKSLRDSYLAATHV
ncbi:MAG TPA: oligosaccharide flippase family protein [Alphaproteobacteria bacterium]